MPYKDRERQNEYCRKYQKKNREKVGEYVKKYRRKRVLPINGKVIYGLNKRDWTGCCEICQRKNTRFVYHHWDDENPNKGLWVCFKCHSICHIVDDFENQLPYIEKYTNLKQKIEEGK